MANYVFAYKGGGMAATDAEREAAMAAWGSWFQTLGSAVVDAGNPFGPSIAVNGGGANGASVLGIDRLLDRRGRQPRCGERAREGLPRVRERRQRGRVRDDPDHVARCERACAPRTIVPAHARRRVTARRDAASAPPLVTCSSSPPTRTRSPGCSWRPRRDSRAPFTSDLLALQERPRLAAAVDDAGELEQLAQPDRLAPDRHVARA